uniref:Uncharacterized protein n=1 Tax=Meloidogyne enterolobii TaxID=390850 RepID=A0A6V7VB34_MELEN|nr:unnamed protein product [Meloidogyne enterolobii]
MSSSFPYGQQPSGNGNSSNGNGNQSSNNGTNSTLNVSVQNAAALAALVQQQQQQLDTSSPISSLVADQFQQNQDLRTLALHQQLSTLMQQAQLQQQQQQQPAVSQSQQQQPQPSLSAFLPLNQQIRQQQQPAPCSSAQLQQQQQQQTNPGGSSLLGIYQHLLSLQAQQQQQTPTVAGLPQQFSNALHLQNSSPAASVLPPQLGGGVPSAQSATSGSTAGLLSTLLASNPALLHSLLGQQQQQQQQQLVALAAQLLLPTAAQQQQQQQSQQSSLLQMLNPTTLYAFVNYLQQQQQAQQPPPVNQQLQLLLQLASNGGGNVGGNTGGLQGLLASLSGNQQQALLTALAAQQAQQQQEATTQQPPPPQLHQQPPPSLQPQQPDENRLLLEHLIRQSREVQQQQKLMQLEAVAAGRPQTYVGSEQIEHSTPATLSPTIGGSTASEVLPAPPQQVQQTSAEVLAAHQQQQQQQQHENIGATIHSQINAEQQEQQRQGQGTPNERLMTSEAVQDRISRLISENEAILEPNPVLLKRRPYQRQSTSNSMTSQTSENAGTSQRGSPGIRSPGPKHHPATTRSYSLHETSFLRFGGGSLTSGQPINRQQLSLQPQPSQHSQQLTCNFCHLKFPNEAGLEAHELRCSKKDSNSCSNQILLQKQQSQPQLKMVHQQRQQQHQQQLQLQLQQLQDHQSTIAALVGGGKGVARDLVINGSGGGRSSVPSLIQQHFSKQQSNISQLVTSSSSDSRLKKRGLDQDSGSCGSGTDSLEMIYDVSNGGNGGEQQQQQHGAESSKMARIDDMYSMEIQQQEHIQQNIQTNIQKDQQHSQNSPKNLHHHQQQKAQPILTMRDAVIFAITYSTDLCSTIKMPYFLTLTQNELQELAANGGEQGNDVVNNGGGGAGSSCNIRGRTRNITSETFMCLNKVRPTPNEHRDNCSAYSFWTPSEFSNGESQLIQLLLCATNSFSAPWQKRICPLGSHYTLAANKESIQLRTTHSSFWGQQQQQKIAQQQTNNTIFNPQRQHCDDLMIERGGGLIKNIPKNEDMEELYQLENSQIIKMDTDDKENGSLQQSAPFLPSKMDEEEINTKIITTTDNSIKLLKLPPNATSKGVGGFGGGKYSFNKTKTNINEEVPISTTQAMVQVYIRGRGRGRYFPHKCPSIHLHDLQFFFQNKRNLTKHLVSKTHKRRMLDSNNEETMQGINTTKSLLERNYGNEEEGEEGGRLVVVEEDEEEEDNNNNIPTTSSKEQQQRLERIQEQEQRMRWEEEDWDDDDEEDEEDWGLLVDHTPQKDVVPPPPPLNYRHFGQENILVERETHTLQLFGLVQIVSAL